MNKKIQRQDMQISHTDTTNQNRAAKEDNVVEGENSKKTFPFK